MGGYTESQLARLTDIFRRVLALREHVLGHGLERGDVKLCWSFRASFFSTTVRILTSLTVCPSILRRENLLSVIGPSGCGKRTIFRPTNQLLPRRSGEILVDGKSIDGRRGYLRLHAAARPAVPWRTVNENLRLPMEIRGGISRAEMDKRAAETLEHVGLTGWGDKRLEELPGHASACGNSRVR